MDAFSDAIWRVHDIVLFEGNVAGINEYHQNIWRIARIMWMFVFNTVVSNQNMIENKIL